MRRDRPHRVLVVVGAALAALMAFAGFGTAAPSIVAQAPGNTSPPTISGSPVQGQTLTGGSGSWSGSTPIAFSYRWQRCNASGGSCSSIGGATAPTYTLGSNDVGKTMRFQVTATNAEGAASALSSQTDVVTATSAKPANTAEPKITGTTEEGKTLTGSTGSWTGQQPLSFSYQWVRCGSDGGKSDGSDCTVISGATSTTYTLKRDDVGKRLRFRVTASNSAGSETAASNPTQTIRAKTGSAPRIVKDPSISGNAVQGQILRANRGTWSGATPMTFSYQWLRCDARGNGCVSIPGATRDTLTLGASEVGKTVRVRVTAKNSAGSKFETSAPTKVVTSSAPAGVVVLPNGEKSAPAAGIPSNHRMIVDRVVFSPNPVTSRNVPIRVRIKVKDTRGYVIRDAVVFIRSTPKVTSGGDDRVTGTDGWIEYTLVPESDFPVRNGYNVQFFVKAYRKSDPVLAGAAGYRLVQVATQKP